ncbi:unnamed protein product [Schistosoma curassoni]|uniref:GATA zinc finger domain-containing protein 14-like n=1 Tax=Schistosoma curassoni TaxID=6186 RepID=A0A183JIF3_9TREM|nr:unnamed protein product [Schistosoma curassoni]
MGTWTDTYMCLISPLLLLPFSIAITPMVNDAKGLVTNIEDPRMHDQWRLSNRNLLTAVNSVKQAVSPSFNNPINYYHEHYRPISVHKNGINSTNTSISSNSCNNIHNNNNNNNSVSSSKSSQASIKETTPSIPLREMQEISITDVSHIPYSYIDNNNSNDYIYHTSHYHHKPVYEIKLSNPLHHSPSSPPLPHHQKQHITTTSHHHHHHHHQPYSSPTHSYQQSSPLHQAYSPGHYTNNNSSNNNLHSPSSPPYQQQNHHYHPHNHSKHHHHQTENINTYLTMKHNDDYLCTDEDRQQQSGTISLHDAVSTTTTAADVPARTSTPDTEVDEEFNFPPPEENQPIMVSENYIYVFFLKPVKNDLYKFSPRFERLVCQMN